MIQIVYTNSNCSDVFIPFLKQNKKHCTLPLYVISDYDITGSVNGIHKYSNYEEYWKVWSDALKKFGADYFIYLQEDFYLYSDVNMVKLEEYKKFLDTSDYSYVRLINSGVLGDKLIAPNLYEIEPENHFSYSQQPTIWKTKDYLELLSRTKEPKWLETPNYRAKMIEMNMKGVYHFDGEPKRGKNHHDTNVYPYIATAIIKGKWNLKEYPSELGRILNENNIKPKNRGVY